jgi:ribosomal protein S18 acetylase RimI-like enzyme
MAQLELRSATADDVPALARLTAMAGDGLFDALYENTIPGVPTHGVIERRLLRTGTTKSFENCWVAALLNEVVGGLNAYPIDAEEADPANPLLRADRRYLLEPFKHLHVPGSFYLSTISVFPEYRGQGCGVKLLSFVRSHARKCGFGEISLISFEQNTRAVALYERFGFRVIRRRPAVAHQLVHYSSGNLVLMTCPV